MELGTESGTDQHESIDSHPQDRLQSQILWMSVDIRLTMEKLFVYGSLQSAFIQYKVLGRVCEGQIDILDNYLRSDISLDGSVYPIAVPLEGEYIEGTILELTDEELQRADIYETEAYRRIKVTLRSGAEVWMYAK